MLGAREVPLESRNQLRIRLVARHFGTENTCTHTPCGICFGAAGKTVPDPHFGAKGPARIVCWRCGGTARPPTNLSRR